MNPLTDNHFTGGKAATAHTAFNFRTRPRAFEGLPRDPSATAADPAAHVLQVRDGGRQDHSQAAAVLIRVRHVRNGPSSETDANKAAVLVVVLHL